MAPYINPIPMLDPLESVSRQDYESEVNDYTPKKAVYFAFIDVLGFRKTFDDNRLANNNLNQENCADKFRGVFTYYFDLMNWFKQKIDYEVPQFYAGQTSDSLYFYTEKAYVLIEFLKIFSHFNSYAMTKDVFFRGGIAKGNLFCKENYQFYGESVINAYLIESEISKTPIVTIDENTYCDMVDYVERDGWIITKKNRHYLGPFACLENDFKLIIDDFPIKIREINEDELLKTIESNKAKFEYDARNYEKYIFLLTEYDEYKKRYNSKIGGKSND